jgi:hypothetical protein
MWAVVEIMGHRTRAGRVSDATLGGATLLRVEHPTRLAEGPDEPLAEYYAPQAIFAIRPCSLDEAMRVADMYWGQPLARPALAAALEDLVDGDEADVVDPLDDMGVPF